MFNFATQYHERERIFQSPGNPIRTLYVAQFDEFGNHELVETGKENLYDYIQSFKESCDIHVIMERYARGDVEALSRRQAMFADVTDLPDTFAGMLNAITQGEQYFESLPLDVRERFDNSFAKWITAMDDMPGFLEKMGEEVPSREEPAPVDPGLEPKEPVSAT